MMKYRRYTPIYLFGWTLMTSRKSWLIDRLFSELHHTLLRFLGKSSHVPNIFGWLKSLLVWLESCHLRSLKTAELQKQAQNPPPRTPLKRNGWEPKNHIESPNVRGKYSSKNSILSMEFPGSLNRW